MKRNSFAKWLYICLICCLFLPFESLQAAEEDTPEKNKIKAINSIELKQKIDAAYPFTLINTLSSIEFKELSIRDSINIPSSKFSKDYSLVPNDKARMLIFYDKGPGMNKSRVAAKKAKDAGYNNIMIYEGGLTAWIRNRFLVTRQVKYPKVKIPSMTLGEVDQISSDSLVLLDIRGEDTKLKDDDHIKSENSISIQLDDLEEQYTDLPKDKKIVIVDHAGKQVDICARFLTMKGYTDLAVLEGGAGVLLEKEQTNTQDKEAEHH